MAGTTLNFKVMKFSVSKDHLILVCYTGAITGNISHIENEMYGLSKRISIISNIFIRKFCKSIKINCIYIIRLVRNFKKA